MNVSVVIPTLNAGRWLGCQLEALISQTVEAEILVIDSLENTDEISVSEL